MPLAPVDDQGTQLYFEDTGAPPGSASYPTLLLVHGTVFHGGIFARMLPFAAPHNIRIVTINMRDYPKSTPYSAAELAVIRDGDFQSQSALMAARGVEIAVFLEWFIKENSIPPLSVTATPDGTGDVATGGVSVSGWSYGNSILFSFLAHADKVPAKTRDFLDGYLRTYVIYDAPGYAVGSLHPPLKDLYAPLRDPSLTPEQVAEQFALWVSGYYAYSPRVIFHLDSFDRPDEFFAEMAKARYPIADPPPDQTPTLLRMSAEESASCADVEGGPRSHVPLLFIDREVYVANLRAALMAPTAWRRLRTVAVWCDMGVCDTVFGAYELTQMLKMSWPSTGRKVEVQRFVGANHFPHWDIPEKTVQYFASVI